MLATTIRAYCTLPLVSYGRRLAFKKLELVDPLKIHMSLLIAMVHVRINSSPLSTAKLDPGEHQLFIRENRENRVNPGYKPCQAMVVWKYPSEDFNLSRVDKTGLG